MGAQDAPAVLVLQLKRFEFSMRSRSKISKRVDFETTLDLAPFMSNRCAAALPTAPPSALSTPAIPRRTAAPRTRTQHRAGAWRVELRSATSHVIIAEETRERRRRAGGCRRAARRYQLFGVLVHHGHSLHAGHYVAFVRGPSGLWHQMDDASVSQAPLRRCPAATAPEAASTPSQTARTPLLPLEHGTACDHGTSWHAHRAVVAAIVVLSMQRAALRLAQTLQRAGRAGERAGGPGAEGLHPVLCAGGGGPPGHRRPGSRPEAGGRQGRRGPRS